ncbi:putative transcription factor interactor and regulator C3H-WRC/GRF family [Helianthus annuus]|nr:putative transcription factor interactor and regulator C3H-WRC/GRF family [Helianthus annuus]
MHQCLQSAQDTHHLYNKGFLLLFNFFICLYPSLKHPNSTSSFFSFLRLISARATKFSRIKMMSTTAGEGVRNHSGRYPFTATQWQELEHQALVYKYMISGMPIPPDLLFTIKTSLDSSTKLLLHHQPPHPSSIGWNCFQMGFGRKIDPEPGRCRRTDGKKWRCSKEAYPDSKYCERHMHRGRNRSRKPVEVNMSTPKTPPTAIPMIPSSICTKSPNYPSPNSHPLSSSSSDYYHTNNTTHLPSYSRPSSNVFSQDHFLLDSSPYMRKGYGMKEVIDEHSFFSESSGTIKTDSWQLEPLAMNNSSSKQTTFSDYHQNRYSYQQQQDPGYYDQQLALKIDRNDEPQKVMHHFFDEWPPNDDNNKDSSSTTQLSISIPSSARDFFLSHNAGGNNNNNNTI